MPLLGITFQHPHGFMLFPFLPHSLRQEVNRRFFKQIPKGPLTPWNESLVLELFAHLLQGVAHMHNCQISHRDIKLENVLCKGSNPPHLKNPVLMDFGSAGPLTRSLNSRKDILEIAGEASCHTTMPHRPPELFEGELRVDQPDLDYTKVDVWMLGCTLFAIFYGASPFECEFSRSQVKKLIDLNCKRQRLKRLTLQCMQSQRCLEMQIMMK